MTQSDEKATAGEGGGLVATLGLVLAAGAAGFALVTFLPDGTVPACETAHADEASPPEASAYVALEPLAVALRPDAGARTLRIGLALGLSDGHAELAEADVLRLKDGLLGTLRGVDSETITDPEAMPALREALLEQARSVLGESEVASVLITDFMMR